MASTDTDPSLASALTQALLCWKQGRHVPPLPAQALESLQVAYARPKEMGSKAVWNGTNGRRKLLMINQFSLEKYFAGDSSTDQQA